MRISNKNDLEKKYALSSSQADLVFWLYYNGETQIVKIGKLMLLTPSSIVKMANFLITTGLIKKNRTPGKKCVTLEITDEGIAAVELANLPRAKILSEHLNKSMSQNEQKEVIKLYERLNELSTRLLLSLESGE